MALFRTVRSCWMSGEGEDLALNLERKEEEKKRKYGAFMQCIEYMCRVVFPPELESDYLRANFNGTCWFPSNDERS